VAVFLYEKYMKKRESGKKNEHACLLVSYASGLGKIYLAAFMVCLWVVKSVVLVEAQPPPHPLYLAGHFLLITFPFLTVVKNTSPNTRYAAWA